MINNHDKLLACHRRLFEADQPRYFVGEVIAFNGAAVKIRGYSFVRDLGTGKLLRKPDQRTKIISLIAGTHLLYELPATVSIADLRITSNEGFLVLTDDDEFQMDMTEQPHDGRI